MTGAAETLTELLRRGVTIRVEGGTLRLRPKAALDDDLLALVKAHKPEIIMLVVAGAAPCGSPYCAGCYDIGNGLKIHPPKPGVSLPNRNTEYTRVERTCWHCSGQKRCNCIVCWDGRTGGPGKCVPSKGRGMVWMWVQ